MISPKMILSEKKVFFAMISFLFVLSTFHVCFASDVKVTVYFDDDYPPYSYTADNKLVGIYPDILKTAFSRMDGYQIAMEPIQWKRGLKLIEKGNIFALVPPYYRPKERPYMDYSDPILEERVVSLCRDDVMKKNRFNWPDDYIDLKIGINNGFELIKQQDRNKLNVIESFGNRVNLLNVVRGRLDVYVNDELSMLWELQRLRETGEVIDSKKQSKVVIGTVISRENAYLGFTKLQPEKFLYKTDFVKKFNWVLADMKQRGEVQLIVNRYTGTKKETPLK